MIKKLLGHRYGITLLAYLVAAALTGVACVLFMWSFDAVLKHRLDFQSVGSLCWIITPLGFLFSVELIRRVAPCAAGTGIPQAIFAAKHLDKDTEKKLRPLLSPLTLVVKIVALLIGIWVGASTGREGPTVHIAACVFFGIMLIFRHFTGIEFDLRSVVVAGGAAGLAAAFNTPLAGVTFAIEELTVDYFSSIKDYVLMAIIVAAVFAKILTGEYTYFGKLMDPPSISILSVLIIGLAGGILGALFSTSLMEGQRLLMKFQKGWFRYLGPVLFSLALLLMVLFFGLRVIGPGNDVAQILLQGQTGPWVKWFPITKILSTLLTYWAGMAGGIFAPCLSIGAAMGASLGSWMNVSLTSCALVGMAAFLSGTIQAPITSFVIIFEMTGHHEMLLPIMLASIFSFIVARLIGAKHLYQGLANFYQPLLGDKIEP